MNFHFIDPVCLEFVCEFLVPFLPALIILSVFYLLLRIFD